MVGESSWVTNDADLLMLQIFSCFYFFLKSADVFLNISTDVFSNILQPPFSLT